MVRKSISLMIKYNRIASHSENYPIDAANMPDCGRGGRKDAKIGRGLSLTENCIGGVDSGGDDARRDLDAKTILAAFFACGRLQR